MVYTMNKRPLRRLLSLGLALVLALGGLTLAPAAHAAPAQISVVLGQTTLSPNLADRPTLTATVTPNPTDGGYAPGDLTWNWTSSDTGIALAESHGSSATVTPIKPGKTTITAEVSLAVAGGAPLTAQATCEVTVKPDPPSGLTLSSAFLPLEVGEERDLKATVQPDTADPDAVTWETSDKAIAELSLTAGNTTTVKAVRPGTATVTATAGNQNAICNVTIPGVIITNADDTSLYVGSSLQLGSAVHGDIGTTVEWNSSRADIAPVSANGNVTARAPGKSVITATVKGTSYSTSVTVTVEENTAGLITGTIPAGQPLSFADLASDLSSECRTLLGYPLSYVTGLSVSPRNGVLYYGYLSADDTGFGVGAEKYYLSGGGLGDRSLDKISFVPNLDFTGTSADIQYTGYASNGAYFQGTIRISVERATAITYSTGGDSPARFQAADFNAICRARHGRDLSYVTFSLPLSSQGTLYYNYSGSQLDTKVLDGEAYHRSSSPNLDSVSFLPAKGFTGTASIQYSGRDTQGNAFSGRVVVTVTTTSTADGDIQYQSRQGKSVAFDDDDFNDLCRDLTGSSLNYVRFDLPSSSEGTLYYDYTSSGSYDSKVSSTRNYYRSKSPWLEDVSFVPASAFSGTSNISFTGWSVDGDRFTGTVSITSDTVSAGSIAYSTPRGKAVEFDEEDFESLCRRKTGYSLNYVRFELPSSSRGTLYYNYSSSGNYDSRVSSSKSYYLDSSPYIGRVSLVPASSYSGTVSVPFSAVDVKGNRFNGTVEVTVGNTATSGTITYTAPKTGALRLDDDDFNDLCLDQTGVAMKYVRFSLPSASQGTLYYDWRSGSSRNTPVASTMSYYRTASPYLEDVWLLPADGFSGTCRFSFTGYSVLGDSFSGWVEVSTSGTPSSSKRTVTYTAAPDTPITFNDSDFNDLCRNETDDPLNYLRFDQLPASSQGTLYYNWSSAGKYDSAVSTTRSYYRSSSPYLSSICFVPYSTFSGTVSIPFTAYSTGGDRFSGTIQITVSAPTPAPAIVYSTATAPVAFRLSDFQAACSAKGLQSLQSVLFTLPSDSAGTLYTGYRAPFQYDGTVSPLLTYGVDGTRTIASISFVPKAFWSGTVTIPYTGYDSKGAAFTGTVQIAVRPPATSAYFTDLGSHIWAIPSIDYLYSNKTVSGVSQGRYGPALQIKRGDFLLMMMRCMALPTTSTGGSGFTDVPDTSYYAGAIGAAKGLDILHDTARAFYPERALTRQDAAVYLYNALRAAGHPLPGGDLSSLSRFIDRGAVPGYAQQPMAALVEAGLLSGDDRSQLNPTAPLTRAEMAVILHKTMTL